MPPRTKKPRLASNAPAVRLASSAAHTVQPAVAAQVAPAPAQGDASRHVSRSRFADAPISDDLKKGIKHEYMTDVQEATLLPGLDRNDLLVQAKTGTGKTVAFLLPAIEHLCRIDWNENNIAVLILSPTRELAMQIEDEATALLRHLPFKVQHAIGGTNVNTEKTRIMHRPCDILVATPGRLLDLLSNFGLASKLGNVQTVVYDEADRLLDQGFRKELDKIMDFLPDKVAKPRQALLFSATVSAEIKTVAAKALRKDYQFVSTLLDDEVNTHEHVPQSVVTEPFENSLPATLAIIRQDMLDHPGKSKVMVFFPTARQVGIAAQIFQRLPKLPKILEIHSRISQSARGKAATAFKELASGILMSSDVAARGMDFPNVTLVLQVGLPADADQYVHRLGRTARAGASGRGILVLDPHEMYFLNRGILKTLPIVPHSELPPLATSKQQIKKALTEVPNEDKEKAYRAWLGYYNGPATKMGWTKEQLIREAESYVRLSLGWTDKLPPGIEARPVGMMGMRGMPGLNIVKVSRPPRA